MIAYEGTKHLQVSMAMIVTADTKQDTITKITHQEIWSLADKLQDIDIYQGTRLCMVLKMLR